MDLHRGPERVRVLDHRREDGSRAFAFVKGMSLKGVKEVANAEVEEVAKDAEVAGVAKSSWRRRGRRGGLVSSCIRGRVM